jgi:hypothetical protein
MAVILQLTSDCVTVAAGQHALRHDASVAGELVPLPLPLPLAPPLLKPETSDSSSSAELVPPRSRAEN